MELTGKKQREETRNFWPTQYFYSKITIIFLLEKIDQLEVFNSGPDKS